LYTQETWYIHTYTFLPKTGGRPLAHCTSLSSSCTWLQNVPSKAFVSWQAVILYPVLPAELAGAELAGANVSFWATKI